jgi:hypothetical protein
MSKKLDPKEVEKQYRRIKLKPLEPYIGSGIPRKCECLVCGSIVYPRWNDVKKAKSCVKCQGKNTAKSIRLSDKEINLSAKKMGIKLLQPYVNNRTPIKAKCLSCKKIIYPTVGRLRSGMGCINCGRLKSSVARLIPKEIALEDFRIAKLKVLTEYKNSHQTLKVLCLVCKKFSTKSYKDLKSGRRCYTCGRADAARKRRLSLQYINEIAGRQKLLLVGEPKPGKQDSKFKCLKCQRILDMNIFSIQRGSSCRFCSRTEVDPKEAFEYMVKNQLKPLEPYFKSAAKWKCRCLKCKRVIYPTFNRVNTFGSGCIYCRSAGYNPSFEGHLYLIFNARFDSYKLGISNTKARVRSHELKGWILVSKWDFSDGHIPPILEEELLEHIRTKWNLPWSVDASMMPQGGHTETFSSANLSKVNILKLIDSKIKFIKGNDA